MTRRDWILSTLALSTGCARPTDNAVSATRKAFLSEQITRELEQRARHLDLLQHYRVAADAVRTTPKPKLQLLDIFPELKPLGKISMRLHPRFSDEPKPNESKLGGQFLWPTSKAWPIETPQDIPLAPYLQLRIEDAPPQFPFRSGTDLMQLFVSPAGGSEAPRVQLHWSISTSSGPDLATMPHSPHAMPSRVPFPCRLFPERYLEYPDWNTLSQTALRPKMEAWAIPNSPKWNGPSLYAQEYSSAPGTKVGGYPNWTTEAKPPSCTHCKWGMDYLLTLAHEEWNEQGRDRWQPVEERAQSDTAGFRAACGLDRTLWIFICRRCSDWPVKAVTA